MGTKTGTNVRLSCAQLLGAAAQRRIFEVLSRGLHSFASQLKLSAFYGTGVALRGCVARTKGVFRVCRVFCVCQTRLKLS